MMSKLAGLQIDLHLKQKTPKDLIMWLAKHMDAQGGSDVVNDFFKPGEGFGWGNWIGGKLIRKDKVWHLKSNGCDKHYDLQKIAYFLHELQPWVIPNEDAVVARLIPSDPTQCEIILWYGPTGDVYGRKGLMHGQPGDITHPSQSDLDELGKGWSKEREYPNPTCSTLNRYVFPTQAPVGIKTQKKKMLAAAHNANYTNK